MQVYLFLAERSQGASQSDSFSQLRIFLSPKISSWRSVLPTSSKAKANALAWLQVWHQGWGLGVGVELLVCCKEPWGVGEGGLYLESFISTELMRALSPKFSLFQEQVEADNFLSSLNDEEKTSHGLIWLACCEVMSPVQHPSLLDWDDLMSGNASRRSEKHTAGPANNSPRTCWVCQTV